VTDNDYRAFLRANVPDYNERVRAGEYVDAQGRVLGMHEGFVNYTIGQRKGLGIALGHPAYVTHIDAETNRVTLGTNDDLYASSLTFRVVTPLRLLTDGSPVTAKVRYRSHAVETILQTNTPPVGGGGGGEVCLQFTSPVWGVTPGQSVVLYQGNLVVGGGIIIS